MKAPRPLHVAQRPDAGHAGAQLVVDRDVAARVGGDAGLVEAEVVGVRPPADGGEQVAAVDRQRPARRVDDDAHAAAVRARCDRRVLAPRSGTRRPRARGCAGSRPRPRRPRGRSAGRRTRARSRARRSAGTSARTPGRCSCRRRSTRCSGRKSTSIIEVLVEHRHVGDARPVGQRPARPPTLMKIFGASSDLAVHLDRVRPGEARVAPDEAQVLVPAIHLSRPSIDCRTTPSLRAFTAFMSTLTGPTPTP